MSQVWHKRTVWQAVAASVRAHPERTAVIADDERLTYAELSDLAGRVSLGLLRQGVRRGDKVSLWLPNGLPFLAAALGASRVGAVVVAVNPRFRADEVAYVLRQSDSVAVILSPRTGTTDQLAILADVCPELSTARGGRISSQTLPELQLGVCLGDAPPNLLVWDELLRLGLDHDQAADLAEREAEVTADDVALFQYTSGSTAFPKAVMLSHDSIVRNAWQFGEALAMTPDDVYLVPLPFFHVGGLVTGALCALVHGACVVTMARFEPEAFLRAVEAYQCTVLSGVETTYVMALEHPDLRRFNLSSARRCIALGTSELIRRIHDEMGIPYVCTLYGISEAAPNVSLVRVGEPLEVSLTTMGRPQPGVDVRIVDPARGAELGPGERGEICVRGWNVMRGYYKQPGETAEAIGAEGWLHTGDLGTLDERGYLTFLGRIKNVIRVGGENVSAEEVENCLIGHPAVKIAQVVAGPDPRLSEVCVAYVERKAGESVDEEALIAHCRARLAGYKVPRRVRFVAAVDWPMTGSGKIQRFKLRGREFEATGAAAGYPSPHAEARA